MWSKDFYCTSHTVNNDSISNPVCPNRDSTLFMSSGQIIKSTDPGFGGINSHRGPEVPSLQALLISQASIGQYANKPDWMQSWHFKEGDEELGYPALTDMMQ